MKVRGTLENVTVLGSEDLSSEDQDPTSRTGGVDDRNPGRARIREELTFIQQLRQLNSAFRNSEVHLRLIGLAVLLLAIILATTYEQVQLNAWNGPFYNAIAERNAPDFMRQLVAFGWIAGGLLILSVAQTWASQLYSLNLRRGIASDLLEQWLKSDNALRVQREGGDLSANPDQRIHDDARNLADETTGLSIGVVQAGVLLVSFVGILWTMSGELPVQVFGKSFAVPGYMVWAAFLYVGLASLFSAIVGGNLVRLNAERESREAELRTALVDTVHRLDDIHDVKEQEKTLFSLKAILHRVLVSVWSIARSQTNLTWVSAGFGWLAIIVPILVAAPLYLSGKLTFGGLMVAVGAFNQVHNALRWYVNNFQAIATWKAHLLRVTSFRKALVDTAG